MEMLKINETPVRTSRNYLINNITLKDVKMPKKIGEFNNITYVGESEKISLSTNVKNRKSVYGLGEILENQIVDSANKKIKIDVDSKSGKELEIDFEFDKDNNTLVCDIEIDAKESSKATIILKYTSKDDEEYYHNGRVYLKAAKNSHINVVFVNLLNNKTNNFIAFETTLEDSANAEYTLVDFGGKNSVTNYFADIRGKFANNTLNSIYLGQDEEKIDLNYIAELRGEKTNIDIEAIGALNGKSKKNFKGTIDFKKGAKKATGNENEYCMLLSDTARSIALPMLLCSEEEVEGNHSSSAGKIGDKELFYIMSRGFEKKEAMKLMVRAKFNKVLDRIKNEKLRNEIVEEINNRLD